MRILDRYIVGSFLRNYVLSFLVLVGLYVVLDMVFNFDELLETQSRAGASGLQTLLGIVRDAGDYYFYQVFLYFAQLSGIIPIVAASFTLLRLSHNNELSALLSAGVPLLRVAAPMVLAALVLNALLVVDQELLIPRMIPKLVRKHDEVRHAQRNSFAIRAIQDDQRALLTCRFFPAHDPPMMRGLSMLQPAPHSALVTASAAYWDGSANLWRLEEGRLMAGLAPEATAREQPLQTLRTSITPEELHLYHSGEYVEYLSSQRINQLLARPHGYAKIDLVRAKHARFTQPLVNVILLLLAAGCVLTREPRQLKTAATRCVLLCGLCLASVFIFQQLGAQVPPSWQWPDAWPAMMAWMPIFIFGPVSVWLLDRVKT